MSGSDFRPLEGLLVADFSRVLAGPLATMTLADLGATVVKVERPGQGDDTRLWGPPWAEHASSYFESVNRSKLSATLDLQDKGDAALARQLALRADVLVENFRTGTMERLGLGHAALQAENPGLVYCSVTGFGSGAGAALPGYDFVVQALGGLMSITGEPDGDPLKVGVALVDVVTGKDAVIGILAALQERRRTGRGRRVEVDLLSSLLGSLVNQASAYLATGTAPGRMGNEHPSIAPYETLECADASIAVACGTDKQFATLCRILEASALADDPRFINNASRVLNRASLREELQARLSRRRAEDWSVLLVEAGIPAGRIGDVGSGIALAKSLGLSPTVGAGSGSTDQIRHPARYDGLPLTRLTRPPLLGEHDDPVRRWLADPSDPEGLKEPYDVDGAR